MKSILVSPFISMPREVRPVEIVEDEDKNEGKWYENFTIRGYVANVCKRNTQICWPFCMLHKNKLHLNANSLPPLHLSKFRHWNCEHCLHGIASATIFAGGATGPSQNAEVNCISTSHGSSNLASQSCEEISLPGSEQITEGKVLREQLIAANNNVGVSYVESHPKVRLAEIEKGILVRGLTRGLDILKAGHGNCEVIQNVASDTVATRECPGEKTVMINTNTLAAHGEGATDLLSAITMGVELVHEISSSDKESVHRISGLHIESVQEIPGSDMNANPTFAITDVAISGKKEDIARHVHDTDFMEFEESDPDTCSIDIRQTECTAQHRRRANEILLSDTQLHRRKVRKVRLLDDIMRSEASRVLSEEISVRSEKESESESESQSEYNPIGDEQDKKPHTYNETYADCEIHLLYQKTQTNPSSKRARHLSLLNEDDHPSLIHWLKRPTRIKLTDLEGNSKQTTAAYARDSRHFDKVSASNVHKSKRNLQREKKSLPLSSIKHKKKSASRINLAVSEDTATNKPRTKAIDAQCKRIHISSDSSQASLYGSEIQHNNRRKSTMHRTASKSSQVGDKAACQENLPKDSFSKQVTQNITCFEEANWVVKKKRTGAVTKNEFSDHIPMDIVELLANMHQSWLMDAKAATLPKSISTSCLNAVEDQGKLLEYARHRDSSKYLSRNTITYLENNMNSDHSSNSVMPMRHLFQDNEDVTVTSIGLENNQHQRGLIDAEAATMPKSFVGSAFVRWNAKGHGKLVADALHQNSNNADTYLGNNKNVLHSSNSKTNSHLFQNYEAVASIGLPNNQNERQLMHLKTTTLPEVTSGSGSSSADYHEKMVADVVHHDFSWRKNMLSHTVPYLGNKKTAENSPNSHRSTRHLSRNKENATLASAGDANNQCQHHTRLMDAKAIFLPKCIRSSSFNTEAERKSVVDAMPQGFLHWKTMSNNMDNNLRNNRSSQDSPNSGKPTSHSEQNKKDATVSSLGLPTVLLGYRFHHIRSQCDATPCKPIRPVPRVGVFVSLLQKEIAYHATRGAPEYRANRGAPAFDLRLGLCNKLNSPQTKKKRE